MTSYTAEQFLALADRLEPQQYATGISFSHSDFRMVIAALRLAAAATDEPEACIACNVPLVDGDMVYSESSGGCIHEACCGPGRESYVGIDPLKDDEPIPTPWRWTHDLLPVEPAPAKAAGGVREAFSDVTEASWNDLLSHVDKTSVGFARSWRKRLEVLRAALAREDKAGAEEDGDCRWPEDLHPRTLVLVKRFAVALAKKLRLAEEKYGYSDGWSRNDWEIECREHLYRHLEKGDPRDVAAYCAFMWVHRWSTASEPCNISNPSYHDCPNMKEVGGGFEGERYCCAVCGKGYFLDYEDMK